MNPDDVVTPVSAPPRRSAAGIVLSGLIAPALLVVGGLVCAGALITLRPTATREAPVAAVPTVEVRALSAITQPAAITASGVVTPARQVRLTAEVAGRIVSQSDSLHPGGRFRKGEVLAQIDPRDYQAAVAQQERAVRQAELELELERSRGSLAEREWKLLGDAERTDTSLALRKPHLRAAEQALAAAEAALDQAKHNVSRTRLTAPFDAVVIEETLDVGQVVGPGASVATLVGTEELWVQVSMPVEKLAGVSVPGFGSEVGSPARVVHQLGAGQAVVREGVVKQLMGQLDPQTRTAQVLIAVPDPLGGEGLPLLPGAWVNVGIEGRALTDTWEIPRATLDQGRYVWVVDPEGSLRRRDVEIGWRTPDTVVVTAGFEAGDQLVTSPLTLPVDGAPVRATPEAG